jgi:hypothetical protein
MYFLKILSSLNLLFPQPLISPMFLKKLYIEFSNYLIQQRCSNQMKNKNFLQHKFTNFKKAYQTTPIKVILQTQVNLI